MEKFCFTVCYIRATASCSYTAGSSIRAVREVLSGKEGQEKKPGRVCLEGLGNMFPNPKDGSDFSNEMMLKWEQ